MAQKPGSQVALFTDQEVRRDYLKSKQWVDTHIRVKVHLTGYASAYEAVSWNHARDPDRKPLPAREQGSLYSQQKHAIADAVEWIRQNSRYKPRIFVATTPGFMDHPKEGKFISKLVHNLTNGYGMGNYVWVRELTANGYPHFHFVADVDRFHPVDLSRYWSKLFDSQALNSIRLGTAPNSQGQRNFWIKNQRMCWYLTKYIGKSLGKSEASSRKTFQTFRISKEARQKSQPLVYDSRVIELYNGKHHREFSLCDEQTEPGLPQHVNPGDFSWKWTGYGQTYTGFKQKFKNIS